MSSMSLGDLAQSYMLQRRSTAIRQDMTRLTQELSTGQKSDMRTVLGGNHGYLSQLELSLNTLDSFAVASKETGHFMQAMQLALEQAQDTAGSLGADLLSANQNPVAYLAGNPSERAAGALESVVSAFNQQSAGRSLFAGTATNALPLASPDILLTELRTAITGAGDAQAMMDAATLWFDSAGGFEALVYQGSANGLAPFQLSDRENVALDVKVNDPAIRDVLRNLAMAALAEDPTLALSDGDKSAILAQTGAGLLVGQDALTSVRASVGFAQERVEEISARNAAAKTGFELARNELTAIDPFEVATKLEDVQFQLQSLYAVTVKSSQLSLVNFL